jgi:hypothetical protein
MIEDSKAQNGDGFDQWEEDKQDKEKLDACNYRNQAGHYLRQADIVRVAQREFWDNQHGLSATTLMDPSKVPRECIQDLFEASSVARVNYEKIPNFEPKEKAVISSSDVSTYLKAQTIEQNFFTFGDFASRQQRLCQRLHRYLKTNLAPYVQKCSPELKEPQLLEDAQQVENFEPMDVAVVAGQWFDFDGKKSVLFYALGGEDVDSLPKHPDEVEEEPGQLTPEEQAQKDFDKAQAKRQREINYFGKVEVDAATLSGLYQDCLDLVDKMKWSAGRSADQN